MTLTAVDNPVSVHHLIWSEYSLNLMMVCLDIARELCNFLFKNKQTNKQNKTTYSELEVCSSECEHLADREDLATEMLCDGIMGNVGSSVFGFGILFETIFLFSLICLFRLNTRITEVQHQVVGLPP